MNAGNNKGGSWQAPAPESLETAEEASRISGPIQERAALNPNTKRAAVLRVFLERGQRGLTCFEAVRLAHDYVLRTTVSECARYHGIKFSKKFEQVPGFNNSRVDCIRYSLTSEGAARVRELLGDNLKAAA